MFIIFNVFFFLWGVGRERGRTMAPSSDCKDVQTILFTHMKVWKS